MQTSGRQAINIFAPAPPPAVDRVFVKLCRRNQHRNIRGYAQTHTHTHAVCTFESHRRCFPRRPPESDDSTHVPTVLCACGVPVRVCHIGPPITHFPRRIRNRKRNKLILKRTLRHYTHTHTRGQPNLGETNNTETVGNCSKDDFLLNVASC